jgi:hypothetical protein
LLQRIATLHQLDRSTSLIAYRLRNLRGDLPNETPDAHYKEFVRGKEPEATNQKAVPVPRAPYAVMRLTHCVWRATTCAVARNGSHAWMHTSTYEQATKNS